MAVKKGFIHIVEISFAVLILSITIFLTFAALNIKTTYDRSNLYEVGENIYSIINQTNLKDKMFTDREEFIRDLENITPSLVTTGIEIQGTAKPIIRVGCANCSVEALIILKNQLRNTYYNNRWINFTVQRFTFTKLSDTEQYDVLVFVNYTYFDNNKLVQDYLKEGGKVLAITRIECKNSLRTRLRDIIRNPESYCENFTNMNDTFSLTVDRNLGDYTTTDNVLYLQNIETKVPSYFLGNGFVIIADRTVEDKQQGTWTLWRKDREVNITTNLKVEIEGVGRYGERDIFCLNPSDDNSILPDERICFRIKKVFPDKVFIQTLNFSFPFLDYFNTFNLFSPTVELRVKGIFDSDDILKYKDRFSLVVWNSTTKNAVWISYYPYSEEYSSLLRSTIIKLTDDFVLKSYFGTKENIEIPFISYSCCDIPEEYKIKLILGYKY